MTTRDRHVIPGRLALPRAGQGPRRPGFVRRHWPTARPIVTVTLIWLAHRQLHDLLATGLTVLAALLWGLWWWARSVEPRLFASRYPTSQTVGGRPSVRGELPGGDDGHLAFAQALHHAAELYLTECERRVQARHERDGWQ
jgi:hypothetical protein